jgi:hypothetical protein
MQWCVTFTTKKIMARITDINELRAEISRLRGVAEQQEQLIRQDATAIRENLKPMNLLMNTLSALTGVQLSKSTFVNNGFVFGLSLMMQRLLLKTENQMADKVHRWTEALIGKINDFMTKHSESPKQKD